MKKTNSSLFLRGLTIAVAVSATALAVHAQTQPPSKSEQAIKYRQSVYKVILWNFGPMAAMVQGKAPYDAADFARRAERVGLMTPMLLEGYPPDSLTGAETRAKPEIWQNMDDFRTLMQTLNDKTAALASVTKGGDLDKSKATFTEVANACKACHDKYRKE